MWLLLAALNGDCFCCLTTATADIVRRTPSLTAATTHTNVGSRAAVPIWQSGGLLSAAVALLCHDNSRRDLLSLLLLEQMCVIRTHPPSYGRS